VSRAGRLPAWIQAAVFSLDRWLCRRMGVYEFSNDPQCLFRLQFERVDTAVELTDGTRVTAGSRVLALHLWNEHVPRMDRRGPTLAWACRIEHAMQRSLGELAGYLSTQPQLRDIAALCVDMRVSASQSARLLGRCGFEAIPGDSDQRGVLHRIGDAIFIVMLMLVTHPLASRSAALHLRKERRWLSRAALGQRYAAAGCRRAAAAPEPCTPDPVGRGSQPLT
jgi:hypothetical protein